MRTTLLIPVLNEIDGMRAILPRIQKDWVDEIVVVDGGSTDGSFEFAREQGFKAIRQKSKGITPAYWEGLEAATGDVIIPFSPDGNSIPEKIPELVQKMKEGFDMVIVSRYYDGARSEDDNAVTGFGNWIFTQTINLLFGGHYTDCLVMFRGWKRSLLKDFGMDQPRWDVEMGGFEPALSILCAKRKRRVREIPGDEPKRLSGERKTNFMRGGLGILLLILKGIVTR